MWRWLLSLPLLTIVLAAPAVSQPPKDEKEKPTGLEVGKDLPGPFRPYNVTGDHAGRFHCLVTQASLDPLVIVFVRDLEYTDALKALEEGLDARIAKNPNVRLNSFTVFVSDELANVVEDDDKRDKMADDLRGRAKDLKSVVFCLDSKSDMVNYKLDADAWATVVLVKEYKVVALHKYTRDKLNAAAVEEIMGEVAERLGATRQ